MDRIVDFILCSGVVGLELIGVLAIAMLIQGITYWTIKFSIYNYLIKVLVK